MTLYSIALFLHVTGAVLLFTTLSLEGVGLWQIRRATTADQVRDSAGIAGLNRIVGPAAGLGILVPGLYMTATAWGWRPWIVIGLTAWILVAILGAFNGIRLAALGRAVGNGAPLPAELAARFRNPMLLASWRVRVAIALGVVFLMTVKPDLSGALVAIAAAALVGAAASLPAWRREPPGTPDLPGEEKEALA